MATQAEVQEARAKLLRMRASSGPVPEGYVPKGGPKYQYRQPGANPPLPTGPVPNTQGNRPLQQTLGVRPDLGAEMQVGLDEQVADNAAAAAEQLRSERTLPEALAAADPPVNMSTPPKAEIFKQAMGEPATEPYEPIQIAPKGPNNDAQMIPGTGGPGAPGEVITDTVEVEPVWTPQASLEREMDLWQQNPNDFSGMEGVERGRKNDARRDAQGGMLLSTFGGTRLAPRGGEVFQKAMASKPIRPNAADLGYFDPETGDYVENPTNAKTRRDKILSGRIDAMNRQMNVESQQQQNRLKQLELTTDKAEERQLRKEIEAAKIKQKELDRAQKYATETAKYGQGIKGLQSLGGGPVYTKDGKYVDAQGNPTEALSHSDATKRQKAIRGAKHNLSELNRLTEDIVKYAGGFGKDVGMASTSPTILGKYLTSEEISTRVGVYRQAYQTIKNLAGAALSPAESERIEAFVPGPNDPPGLVAVKVWEAQREFNEILAENGEPLMDMGPRPDFGLRDSEEVEPTRPRIPRSGGRASDSTYKGAGGDRRAPEENKTVTTPSGGTYKRR
jgi:hypothetical protein